MTETPEWERCAREASAAEWDSSYPRWNMKRDSFIEWHVKMAKSAEAKRARFNARLARLDA